MLQVKNLRKDFGDKTVVKDVSFSVEEGQMLVLLGRSGCGKTTTLKMINRLIEPTAGSITINGKDVLAANPVELRRSIGYVIQSTGLFPHYTVEENIGLVPKMLRWEKEVIMRRVGALCELLGLPLSLLKQYPHELSGGQQQRVGVARALAADPPLILLDEPFGALDPITRHEIQQEFKSLEQLLNKTMVMVTHDVSEAITLADEICLMDAGEIVQRGRPKDILFQPATPFVKQFFQKDALTLSLQALTLGDVQAWLPTSTKEVLGKEWKPWTAQSLSSFLNEATAGGTHLASVHSTVQNAIWNALQQYKQSLQPMKKGGGND